MARRGAFSQRSDGQGGQNGSTVRQKPSGGTFSTKTQGQGGQNGAKINQRPSGGNFGSSIALPGANDCDRPTGGDRTVLPPGYVQTIRNRPTTGVDRSCLWQDDNGIIVQENDLDTICIDNA